MVGFGRERADWGIEAMVVFGAAALVLLVAAMVSDLRFRLIPDWTAGGILLLFLVPHLAMGAWGVLAHGLAAAVLTFAIGAAFFWCGWLGGGDVKLLASLAAWGGFGGLAHFALLTSLLGGVLSLACAGWALIGRWRGETRPLAGIEVPYGVAIALGGTPLVLSVW
jgi:prepilin peptidase CpaA